MGVERSLQRAPSFPLAAVRLPGWSMPVCTSWMYHNLSLYITSVVRGSSSKLTLTSVITYRKVSAPRKWASAALLWESELFGAQFFRLHGDSSDRTVVIILHFHGLLDWKVATGGWHGGAARPSCRLMRSTYLPHCTLPRVSTRLHRVELRAASTMSVRNMRRGQH